jgi:hypothetical protein
MKYVIVDVEGLELPIIFPDIINHSQFKGWCPVSAGEVQLYGAQGPLESTCCCENAIDVSAFGGSTSLNLKSRPQDAEIIRTELMRHYH